MSGERPANGDVMGVLREVDPHVLDRAIRPEPEPVVTNRARKEAVDFSAGKLERDESVRWHLHLGGIIAFWLFLAAGGVLLVTWIYHLVVSESYHFLTAQQRFDLQTIVLSVIGSSFVTAMARNWSRKMDE